LASAAVVLIMENGVLRSGRITLGGVGTKPWRAVKAEQLLTGRPSTELFSTVATTALEGARPYTDNGFKIELAKRTLVRALTIAGGIA
jgi:xanthine dehydrogenase YagS FAD-binding subunit